MGRVYEGITDELGRWIGEQPVFFVATAVPNPDTHVNLSPRGLDTFRVLDPNRVAWLDLTGSGVETIAHLKVGGSAGGRITLMLCAFEGPPQIVRLYGHGRVYEPGDGDFEALRTRFPELPGERSIIDVAVHRVATSCGYGVPRMELLGSREELLASAERKGPEKMAEYRDRRNAHSIDGLPGMGNVVPMQRDRRRSRRNTESRLAGHSSKTDGLRTGEEQQHDRTILARRRSQGGRGRLR